MPVTDSPEFLVADLAVARGFASRDEVWPLFAAWLAQPTEPFLQKLASSRLLSAADLDLLGSLVYEQLRQSRRSTTGLGWEPMEETDVTVESTPGPAESGRLPHPEPRAAGQFRVVREHAEGGLGRVSVAIDERLGREVALKEIRPDKQHRDDLKARFLREATIAGRLEHPGIVPVYAFGEHDDGQPYYAMRFVTGETLGDAIHRFHAGKPDFDSLAFRQLLNRFTTVCEAMAYAHTKEIVHRDLKPANIMVGQFGETQVVDWGLAKQLAESGPVQPEGSHLDATQTFGAIGTAAYMSPEQAAGHTAEVGPASDIYSLGATLYHLLTGKPPFAGLPVHSVLAQAQTGEFDPPRQIRPGIPKALEAICLRAMALSPADRYPTAQALGHDVQQWLADQPVSAFTEPIISRMKRWARKHPGVVTGVAAGLLVGTISLSTGLYFVYAEKGRTEVARAAEKEQREESEAVINFVEDRVFAAARPKGEDGGLGSDVLLRDALISAAATIPSHFNERPLVRARVHSSFGRTFALAGLFAEAKPMLLEAVTLYTVTRGPAHDTTLDAMNDLSNVLAELGDISGAKRLMTCIYDERRRTLGDGDLRTLKHMANLATLQMDDGEYKQASKVNSELLELCIRHLGDGHQLTIQSLCDLGDCSLHLGDHLQALGHYTIAVERGERHLGENDPTTMFAMKGLGATLTTLGRHDEALHIKKKVLALRKAVYGGDHPATLASENSLANTFFELKRHDEAIAIRDRLYQASRKTSGPDGMVTLLNQVNLASSLEAVGRIDDGLSHRLAAANSFRSKFGLAHPEAIKCMRELAIALSRNGNHLRAREILTEVLPHAAQNPNIPYQVYCDLYEHLCRTFVQEGDVDGGRACAKQWDALGRTKSVDYANAAMLFSMVSGLDPTGDDADKAMAWLQKAVTAGFSDWAVLKHSKDLEPLRDREDFKRLLAELEAANPEPAKKRPTP